MAILTIRKLSDEVHRGLQLRAAQKGLSMEAEVRQILTDIVHPPERLKLGDEIAEIFQNSGGLTEEEAAFIENTRQRFDPEPMDFDK